MEKKKDLFAILGRKATKEILELLEEHGTAQYKEFKQVASLTTVNMILRNLEDLNLIQHYCEREKRREWYEPTEKGKKVVQCLRELEMLIEE